ncbi:SpoIVB peptidase [Clostridium pasteurianum DSM 525 = ATCC 6013]|uniref:SpoIVB peptidase n=1 Tax=Clostridium pasteurianum DSM 525 = ATCC 6013 TaxID=1262449 RepID=A0A0H3J4R5_CLOPA|nr:SpoIVB peptidase [Clostridium pasteurianum]AJA47987.1 SpoIVB peptidase [Clostridium pasteurianum DSM 525 = ATCC 6013]AJA51975.1 SpoIVB peptidase [Clostridium pasteurianum DSM 525 = ATCC 6013]AOZ75272.1 SpoIVB peptidase [Clostridium pasteurianum DSM 525 = ATCC 6013]AOZ79067.1 SpoIVB peptidase [Clostridium pasteurianum]ELP59890.1 stage IV sporulation protein B [Clostridium pasteurianum DSM 525 = ATCC 6013]
MKNKKLKIMCSILTPIIILTLVTFMSLRNIPETIYVRQGENINYSSMLKVNNSDVTVLKQNTNNQFQTKVKKSVNLLGILPVKTVNLEVVPKIMVYPGGQPVGIKLNTEGVLVVGLSDIDSQNRKVSSPAAEAGVQIGDSIVKIDGENVNNSKTVSDKLKKYKDSILKVTIKRDGKNIEKEIRPIKSDLDNDYKLGLWVRDSTAGVGTLTFYHENSKKFAALGHPITDVDTGTMLSVRNGNIINSSIVSIKKGAKGDPGEVRGIFVNENNPMGNIQSNTISGIYGMTDKILKNHKYNRPIEIGLRNEIKEGDAQILTTIDGETPKLYSIKIEKLLPQDSPGPKSMVIRITDPELLEKTGGIVQGMSGSPIIQNNKIIGAVTHVLINKPDVGYGIYMEWMLKDAGILK